jgi:hypothetical protein
MKRKSINFDNHFSNLYRSLYSIFKEGTIDPYVLIKGLIEGYWCEPWRKYHDTTHLLYHQLKIEELLKDDKSIVMSENKHVFYLASLFHDICYIPDPNIDNEEISIKAFEYFVETNKEYINLEQEEMNLIKIMIDSTSHMDIEVYLKEKESSLTHYESEVVKTFWSIDYGVMNLDFKLLLINESKSILIFHILYIKTLDVKF